MRVVTLENSRLVGGRGGTENIREGKCKHLIWGTKDKYIMGSGERVQRLVTKANFNHSTTAEQHPSK